MLLAVSIGGTLTHFAAPPVLMVAAKWQWDSLFMLTHFGWKAAVGIFLSVAAYYLYFRRDLARLEGFLGDLDDRVCVLRGQWTAHATKVSDT